MILSHKQIEEIAVAVTNDFNEFFFGKDVEIVRFARATPIDQLAKDYLGLSVSFARLSSDGSICGLTAYSEITLEAVAYNAIGQFLMLAEKQAVQNREIGNLRKTAIKECADNIRALQMQSEQLKGVKLRLYEKYTSGSITREEYLRQKTVTDAKIADNEEAIRRGHERMQELDSEQSCSDKRLDEVCSEYQTATALTYELAHAFISAIYIHDQDNIEIVWKFGDIFDKTEISKVVP